MHTAQKRFFAFAPMLAAIVVICATALGDTTAQGRAVFERYKDTVVTMRVVVGTTFGGSESESEQEANATLLDADGLAVLALSAIDPMQMAASFRMSAEEMTTRVISLRMILPDGSEKPAEVVLRDKDLDLVFVRLTEKPDGPLPFVSLDAAGAPEMLDEVVCIMQYGRVARRAHAAFIERVEMIVERPRLFYALGDHRARQLVCSPVFTLDGGFVGVGVMRSITGGEPSRDNIMVVIVPARQIQELTAQVPPTE